MTPTEAQYYRRGKEARDAGHPLSESSRIANRANASWWETGWVDRDLELDEDQDDGETLQSLQD